MKWSNVLSIFVIGVSALASCIESRNQNKSMKDDIIAEHPASTDTATFGTGCFWCTEAIFQRLKGVIKVVSGYSGGSVVNPTYDEVCTGKTGHAEVCQIEYDPNVISYDELLKVFWKVHDPTTLNKQGNDVGPQYRSVVFYHDDAQKAKAEHYKMALDSAGAFSGPVVTAIEPYRNFYSAEAYHQNYFNNNSGQAYCHFVIQPKLDKFEKAFQDQLKKPDTAE